MRLVSIISWHQVGINYSISRGYARFSDLHINAMDSDECFGFCRDCGVSHSLPSAQAILKCRTLMEQLRIHGRIDNLEKGSSDSFNQDRGIPVGSGDCCAPKLLNYAAKRQRKPLSIAEFFWGKETHSRDRLEGEFYSSCLDKCQPLLGFMLCGGTNVRRVC